MNELLLKLEGTIKDAKEKGEKVAEAAIISIIVNAILLAVKLVPNIVDAIKDFINNLGQTEWTTEQLEALIEDIKPPEEY